MLIHAIDIYNLLQVHCVHTPTCIHLFPTWHDCPHFPYVFFFLIITATFCMHTRHTAQPSTHSSCNTTASVHADILSFLFVSFTNYQCIHLHQHRIMITLLPVAFLTIITSLPTPAYTIQDSCLRALVQHGPTSCIQVPFSLFVFIITCLYTSPHLQLHPCSQVPQAIMCPKK